MENAPKRYGLIAFFEKTGRILKFICLHCENLAVLEQRTNSVMHSEKTGKHVHNAYKRRNKALKMQTVEL